ncbi:hypothetical protein EB73_06055 [Mycobacterium sp. SWH-M3]|nr:hypothetical protein EB73_06055 [Mycobacterium sp. SWH-M3]
MTTTPDTPESPLDHPGSLIAALPAVLGFVPEQSLVVVTTDHGQLGCVMRIDLSDDMDEPVAHLAEVAAAAEPHGAVAVIVDENGADCLQCGDAHRHLADTLAYELAAHGVELLAVHVVDRVEVGGRWHCVDWCGRGGVIEDPLSTPMAAAAVLDGRRLYRRRAELVQTVEADPARGDRLRAVIAGMLPGPRRRAQIRAEVESAIAAADELSQGIALSDARMARLAVALGHPHVRDTLYALAVGDNAGAAEALWAELARALPEPWRADALVLLAFSAYVRGDGPLAGVSLDAALRCSPEHRMAGMLDTALQTGMRPEQIRELALSGYRQADRLGVRLPARRTFSGGTSRTEA